MGYQHHNYYKHSSLRIIKAQLVTRLHTFSKSVIYGETLIFALQFQSAQVMSRMSYFDVWNYIYIPWGVNKNCK